MDEIAELKARIERLERWAEAFRKYIQPPEDVPYPRASSIDALPVIEDGPVQK